MKHLSLRRARTPRLLLAAAALGLTIPAAASADVPITAFKAGPVATYNSTTGLSLTQTPFSYDAGCSYGTPGAPFNISNPDIPLTLATQAGATTDYCVAFRLNPGSALAGEDVQTTNVQLPVGSLGEIDTQAKCSLEAFKRESSSVATCPTASQVGTAQAQLGIFTGPGGEITQDSPGRIYALDTPSDKAALLGVALIASNPPGTAETKFTITVSQEGTPTTGLINQTDTLARTVTQAGNTLPVAIKANALRFWGPAAAHPHVGYTFAPPAATPAANFFRVGTTCGTPQVTKLTVTPYAGANPFTQQTPASSNPTTAESTPYNLTGCEKLGFDPTFAISTSGETGPLGHPALSVKITSPEGNEDLGATKITLPLGIATDLTRVQNACPLATFQKAECTSATVIGSAKATLSGINADVVSGDVQMVKVDGQTLPALGLDFKGRLPLRVAGVTTIDSTGRIVNTFSNLPSIPERSLDIELFGGARGILQVNTAKCQVSAFTGELTGQNGKTKTFSTPTKCSESFTAAIKKASSTRPTITVGGVGATSKKIQSIRLGLPPGLTANRNTSKTGFKISGLESTIKAGDVTSSRLNKKQIRFSIPKPGSNGFSILTRTKTLSASRAFTKRKTAITVEVRVVYTDGSKVTVAVPLARK